MTDQKEQPPPDFPELESGGPGMPADEFAGIPTPRRRHPLIALGAAALAFFLLYQIHEDLLYALSHSDARDVGDARTVAATPIEQLPLNEYVRMSGMADRESGVIIDTAGSWSFTQFFRLLGTRSRVFVSRVPDPIPVEQAERDVFVGRLIRFRDLSFQQAIRKHFGSRVTATHFFAPATVREQVVARPGGPLELADVTGEKVALALNDQLAIDVERPEDIRVELPRAKWTDLSAARLAVEQHGGKVLHEAATATDPKSIALVVTFPAATRDPSMHALSELDPRVRLLPVRWTHNVRVADLATGDGGLRFRTGEGEKEIPLARIPAIRTVANVQIPDDALLLREGERPRAHLKVVVAGGLLLAFAIINLLSLRARD